MIPDGQLFSVEGNTMTWKATMFFAPPTVWIGMLRHPDFEKHDLSSLVKCYYGASIMPREILRELLEKFPRAGVYNYYGQAELAPYHCILKAEDARYANERYQFNVPISSFGAIREKLADVTAMTFACEAVVYRLAGLIDDRLATIDKGIDNYYLEYLKGIEEYAAECALTKVFCSESAARSIDEMLQVHGGYGYIAEYPIEQLYRDERVQRIYEGTNEINRILIPSLLALADTAIQIFALESTVLRADSFLTTSNKTKSTLKRLDKKITIFSGTFRSFARYDA